MSQNDLGQSDLTVPRAAARDAEFTEAEARMFGSYGHREGSDVDLLAPLACDLARSLTAAGLPVHHCARCDPLYRPGGVCLFGYPVTPFGSGGAWLVTGGRGTEAGR